MRNPWAFSVWTLIVLLVAGLIVYFYGLPMLSETPGVCHYATTRSFGCSSSFGTFMTFLGAAVAIGIAGLWNRFGRF
jgi:hypothetical protein